MAWFIGQSAVMIVLAFLLGLLVGWLVWGQLLRAADRKIVQLRERVRLCDEEHSRPEPTDAQPAAIVPTVQPIPSPQPAATQPEPVPVHVPQPRVEPEIVVPVAAIAEPVEDLARVEGIGPKIAAALVGAGIRTFAQLAASTEDALTEAINEAGITFAPSLPTWSQQAQLLADGDEEGFKVLTDWLIAGRPPGDELERIEGIGPKMAAALFAAGIRTYLMVAESSEVELRNAIENAGLTFAPSLVTWARQARLLADGDEEGFADLTRRLVAGRDEGRV